MNFTHPFHQCPLHLHLIGVGGTGSELLSHLLRLHQALSALHGYGLQVTVYDPDTVSESNLVRQRYAYTDLGKNKAVTLVSRVNLAGNVGWRAVPQTFTAARLRPKDGEIVITCVDSRAARHEMHELGQRYAFWWLDCGNDHTTGQVLLGKKGTLPLPTELHPELMDLTVPDDAPSCSAAESLSRQDLFVNSRVAVEAADLLWQLLRGELEVQGTYFSLRDHTTAARKFA